MRFVAAYDKDAQPDHWTERGRATSVSNSDITGRPRRSVLPLELCVVDTIKAIVKATFLGAFFLGFIGGFVGAVAALFIWPSSNLGPPVGAIYGVLIGVPIGVLSGFITGLVRVRARKHKAGSENLKNAKPELS